MEYRTYLTIPNLPLEPEEGWEEFISILERDARDFGAVIGWNAENEAEVTLAMDADSAAEAAEISAAAVLAALRQTGHDELYPGAISIERADTERVLA